MKMVEMMNDQSFFFFFFNLCYCILALYMEEEFNSFLFLTTAKNPKIYKIPAMRMCWKVCENSKYI